MPTQRRTPLQSRSRARVESILDVAADVIAENGLEALTTSAVAERSGISVGTLYQYFADRDAIIATLVDRHVETMNTRLVEDFSKLEKLTVSGLVEAAINSHANFYRETPAFVKMWLFGRVSNAIVGRQRKRNLELAKWLRTVADKFDLITDDAPDLGGWFAVEIGDRVLEMAFRDSPNGDPEIIAAGAEMIASYLDRFSTDKGRGGVEIATLPTLGSPDA
ncbi:MAG TPA: TetR/AcrR family transcriptional regulator [Solirubrobacterales bacterium]|jgi:AcrR family transcriptional regulator|nr:TetR/AcrR family transcriptional regulator [Solirubrobacterales bacterium]